MRAALIVGFVLIGLSAPALLLMAREVVIGSVVAERYSVEGIVSSGKGMEGGALRAEIGGHRVELVDDRPILTDEPFKVNDARNVGRRGRFRGEAASDVSTSDRLRE
jgi:hypothetical protein